MYSNSDGRCEFLLHVHVGIGIDDMFILISAWRYTSTKLSVEERIGQTLQSAAVSITITSVTDGLAFGIGEILIKLAIIFIAIRISVLVCYNYARTLNPTYGKTSALQ